ncbi:iron-siderophore ABC transporter substrate-binding protein [Kribbella sandramycini]|uniref:Iron complex transport system substrate-binding protein n=1 Tax=Kribbella sandramycini TaxID=60450 RepID=A0A7Y4KWC5_9ACTN|nr:iron-siderophore ABC transporter substrate-binding protein [Kribbella sandramycini]MBB6567607.1 iron complex transport system substrate-binding protein [Kribbella sandramycini]NOL39790.1 iron-siderophore ABC transporter substrate-binding protein [Kribbella sandramycini]
MPYLQTPELGGGIPRRGVLAGGLALGLAACSKPVADEPAAGRVVEHAFGRTSVPAEPKRVVVLGYTDVEVALALGVVPVGFTDFFGTGLNAWARPLAGTAQPVGFELTDGMPVERILSLKPDLIIATDSLKQPDYDKLAAVVPTVGPLRADGAYGTPWRDHTRRMGEILGREQRAAELIAQAERRYAEARTKHPSFAGKSLSYIWPAAPDFYLYFAVDPRVQALLELGFHLTPIAEKLAKEHPKDFYASIGSERLADYEADVIIGQSYSDEAAAAKRNKVFQAIPAVRRGDLIWLPKNVADGLAFGTVLSTMAVLDDLTNSLAKVV